MPAVTWAVGIVPDDGTATTVSTAAGSRQVVNITPAVSGVSQIMYRSFNVSTAGAMMDNSGINAYDGTCVRP